MRQLRHDIPAAMRTTTSEWRSWWTPLSWWWRYAPAALAAVYFAVLEALNGLRQDNIFMIAAILALYYAGPKLRPVFQLLFPLLLTAVIYDSQRHFADYLRGPVHVQEPYLFDRQYFGITVADGVRLTPNEWWQRHSHPVLDFLTGLAYIIFVPVFVCTAAYFRFGVSRNGVRRYSGQEVARLSTQIMWAFFWVNMLGYSTYYWYAASPPWYVALYGLAEPANLQEPANLAGCAKFDALIGFPFFHEWYGRSADVHGAIPSLHVAYPLQAVYYACRFGKARTVTIAFYLWMCFSAVYLNHHYVLDVLWGSAYALAVCVAMDLIWKAKAARASAVDSASASWQPAASVVPPRKDSNPHVSAHLTIADRATSSHSTQWNGLP